MKIIIETIENITAMQRVELMEILDKLDFIYSYNWITEE